MATLTRELRRSLENTVREARRVAEGGARKVIEQLAVHHHEPYTNMTPEQRELRNALRAHGRQLGDRRDATRGTQAIERLTTECAYEHWHRMLFARFLAETNLLIEPESGMDITLEDCQELARERGEDWLELASQFAERMLPQIFRTNDPVLKLALPPETRADLEKLLKALSREVFIADDSLGWVYQYWQADKKDEVNRSEKKIGADELPAVTQLFTEDYMVFFLLHNTLGAWWAGKVLAAKPALARSAKSEDELRTACSVGDVEWTYLRFVREGDGPWRPAAGSLEGWPKAAKNITVLDPCMGSGHFLVFALPIVAAMRADEEGLASNEAIEAVLRDNLFGLEIDPRCTQIAAFNLALAAWRRIGYLPLPALQLACSGLSLGVSKAEWLKLAEDAIQSLKERFQRSTSDGQTLPDMVERGLARMHDLFVKAPVLGSLIQPGTTGDLIEKGFGELEPLLAMLLPKTKSAELSEMAVTAQGFAKAAQVLTGRFTLVATNVPYLGRMKQDEVLREFAEQEHPLSKSDLATCFIERCMQFTSPGGTCALVTPHNWLFLGTYRYLRKALWQGAEWNFVGRLGPRAFETISGEVVNVVLVGMTNKSAEDRNEIVGIDVSEVPAAQEKAAALKVIDLVRLSQREQAANPDWALLMSGTGGSTRRLRDFADVYQGLGSGDNPRYMLLFWEFDRISEDWEFQQIAPRKVGVDGLSGVLRWEKGGGALAKIGTAHKGLQAANRKGLAVAVTSALHRSPFYGSRFDGTLAVIIPKRDDEFLPIAACVLSDEFPQLVREVDQALSVTESSFGKVRFDVTHWQQIAADRYPSGFPSPQSGNPTQWVFDGLPNKSECPLQVAVSRIVGYRWPRQTGSQCMECSDLAPDSLANHADREGIVTLNPVKGEQPAAVRLTALLADAYGSEWSAAKLDSLLDQVNFAGKSLEDWLRDGFFEQHCALFHQRPFVWHIWDGRRDGFHALVNYHRLAAANGEGRRTLEKLLYSYLGDWIDRQRSDQLLGVEGADARLAAAEHLKSELVSVLHGEPPYDIFVRWKSLEEQPVGWEPDINDGVRINVRPFVTARPFGGRSKGASILRTTPKIKWDKDRGKEPQRPKEDFPWFWGWDEATIDFLGGRNFDGNRWNDLHYSRAVKEAARARKKS